jgi:hypothetical protein
MLLRRRDSLSLSLRLSSFRTRIRRAVESRKHDGCFGVRAFCRGGVVALSGSL